MEKKELNPYLQNLKTALKRIGKSAVWLSNACGLSHSAVTNLFSRNCYPSLNVAWEISRVLGYPLDQMLKGNVEMYQPAGKTKREVTEAKIMDICRSLDEKELDQTLSILADIVDFRRL